MLLVKELVSVTTERCIEEILEYHVVIYTPFICENFLFMHDNAHPHDARIVCEYLQEVNVSVMDWPY